MPPAAAQSDLDAFMQQVLARRDDNWKKLQQYILDEREQIERARAGPHPLWGERRDYTWYIRDGFFVRSPLKVNGVTIGEADRRKYEADYLERVQRRDQRRAREATEAARWPSAPGDVAGLIRQSRQPQFISSAYFLRFKFDAGTYALVGRERLEDRDVLRIEYYPTKLFSERTGARADGRERQRGQDAREEQDKPRRARGAVAADEQGRARHAVDRARVASDREIHVRQRRTLDFLPRAVARCASTTSRASMTMGAAVSGRLAAARAGDAIRRDARARPVRPPVRARLPRLPAGDVDVKIRIPRAALSGAAVAARARAGRARLLQPAPAQPREVVAEIRVHGNVLDAGRRSARARGHRSVGMPFDADTPDDGGRRGCARRAVRERRGAEALRVDCRSLADRPGHHRRRRSGEDRAGPATPGAPPRVGRRARAAG